MSRRPGAPSQPQSFLPPGFVDRVLDDLGQREGQALLTSLQLPPELGLRVNSRYGSVADVLTRCGWDHRILPWAPQGAVVTGSSVANVDGEGETTPETTHPAARHPWHAAGAYYLQDPAAMGVVPVLDPQPGERVLDMAAAPGGKSTYIADRLGGSGLLWSHDVDQGRAGALVGNLERWGAANLVVSHGPIGRLAPLHGTFDRVLLDAPCSGEGMFRKSVAAAELWSERRVAEFVALQADLLDAAVDFLRPGGVLVYSTCTFGAAENENAIAALLERRTGIEAEALTAPGASGGLEPVTTNSDLSRAVARWWPHKQPGEGHFVARLRKVDGSDTPKHAETRRRRSDALPGVPPTSAQLAAFHSFCSSLLSEDAAAGGDLSARTLPAGHLRLFRDWLHLVPLDGLITTLSPNGLAPRRVGTPLGRCLGSRFEPHHALSHLLTDNAETASHLDLDVDDPRVDAYLHGSVIHAPAPDGWVVVRASGAPLGWAKSKRGELNNHYPKGLRRT